MMGIGIGEMILIAGIALVVFGPEKFPDFAKIVIRTVRDLRGYVDEIQTEISKEIKPIKRELDQMNKYSPDKYIDSITKDTKKKASKPASAKKEKGAADPTDRQDDSFDYDDGRGYDHPDADPYSEQTPKTDGAPPAEDNNTPDGASSETDTSHAADSGAEPKPEDKDEWDFSEPPVERLD